jgi:hypothetical protein
MRDTAMLRQAFREAMSRAGQPVTRLKGVVDCRGRTYRTRRSQTIRLMTNRRRALITVAAGFAAEAVMDFEGQQAFIGIAIPGPHRSVECFLVPTDETVERAPQLARRTPCQRQRCASDPV